MTKPRWMRVLLIVLIMAAAVVSQTNSVFADNGLVTKDVDINDSSITINSNVVSNRSLAFPILRYNDIQYLPLNWNLMKSMGYQYTRIGDERVLTKVEPGETFTFDAAATMNPSTSAQAYALEDSAVILFEGEPLDTQGYPLLVHNHMIYLPLTYHVKDALGWFAKNDRIAGFHLSTESEEALNAMIEASDKAYLERLAAFMRKVNPSLSESRAHDYVVWLKDACDRYGMDESWMMAVIWQESSFDANCEYNGAIGIMQIMGSTGRALGLSIEQLYDPQLAIEYGTKYLSQKLDRYGTIERAVIAYNQGYYNVARGDYTTHYLDGVESKRTKVLAFLNAI